MVKQSETGTLAFPRVTQPGKMLVRKSKLFILSGTLLGQEFIVDKDTYTIGSGPNNDLVISDATVSKQHCELQFTNEGYVIRDLGSTNGTIVQGMMVGEAVMNQSTEFQLGETRIVFCPLREATEYNLSENESFGNLLGRSVGMRRVFYQAEKYAPTDVTVLIEGETGTGKEILAEEIHRHSPRANKPFVVIDCSALAKELVESELFGHKKGAFTGANQDRVGAFEHANGGTVFLDEIGDLAPGLQPKLLRVLEKREIRPVGSNEVRNINVRIISATHRRLDAEVNNGRFREDLYFRLSVVHLDIPPLRRRKEDIPMLVRKFLKDNGRQDILDQPQELEKTIEILSNHNWPGNVRELRNLVEIASYGERKTMDISALLCLGSLKNTDDQASPSSFLSDQPFKDAKTNVIDEFEKNYLTGLIKRNDGNISKAAREADIERGYLRRLLKKHSISVEEAE